MATRILVRSRKISILLHKINLIDHAIKIRIVNVQKVIEVPRSQIKSLIVMVKRIHEIFFTVSFENIDGRTEDGCWGPADPLHYLAMKQKLE